MPPSALVSEYIFADVERRLALYLRALWARDIKLRPLLHTRGASAGRRATIDSSTIRMPQSYGGFTGQSGLALYRAAAVHAAAHIVFTTQRFPVGSLKPLQVALVSLIEDARVEHLAMREFPGLRWLWKAFHAAQPGGALTSGSLMARLARALIDEDFEDDNPWVVRGRRLFFEQEDYWQEQSMSRALGGLLGNDMGQMRVQFNVRTYVVEPAYRDDNQGLWDFGDAEQASPDEDEVVMQGARIAHEDRDTGADQDDDETEPPPREEEQVKLIAPSKQDSAITEEPLSPPIRYDEWDYVIGRERASWCTLLEKPSPEGDPRAIEEILERNEDLVNRVKRLVKSVQAQRPVTRRKRLEGDRLDLDACIDAGIDLRTGIAPDPRVHAVRERQQRDLSVLVLLDLSQSTGDRNGEDSTVLSLAREATVLLADAMARLGDSFAIHGFSSNGRHDVGYYRFKDFDRAYGELSKARLAGMTARLSTRMGTALRHAASFLRPRRAHQKLILLVTDGEPSDVDVHDAKKAVEENNRHRIFTYCMSLDAKADRYVSRIFGLRNYMVLDHIRRLPEKLPMVYMRVTS
jgi:hypothetical protein